MKRRKCNMKRILKLTNCLQHQTEDYLWTIFFQDGLQPYLQIATARMKRDILFEHKEVAIIYEKNMGSTTEYPKLLEPPTKQEKASERR